VGSRNGGIPKLPPIIKNSGDYWLDGMAKGDDFAPRAIRFLHGGKSPKALRAKVLWVCYAGKGHLKYAE